MNATIDLDDKPRRQAHEVSDVRADGVLAPELMIAWTVPA